MFNLMKDHHKKLNSLLNLTPRSRENKNKRLEVVIRAGNVYNKLYKIYKSKYNKKIDSLSAKNKKKLDYKQLKISSDYQYSSDQEQEEQEEKQDEKQEKQEEESEESKFLKYIENKSEGISYILFNYYFNFLKPSYLAKKLLETKDKKK